MSRLSWRSNALMLACGLLIGAPASAQLIPGVDTELPASPARLDRLHVTSLGRIVEDTSGLHAPTPGNFYRDRLDCPATILHSQDVFAGGTFTLQGGFAEGEIAAASYTLPGSLFPIQINLMEIIVGQQNATVQTTTHWSILVYDGFPTDPQPSGFPIEYSSDDVILPHIVMNPGTRATNVQVSVDPNDPDQIFIFNPNNLAQKTFTIGLRIDQHHNQTANPCFTAPPANENAFPATDNTVIGCNSGYAQLNQPTQNWLYAVNCGPNGCPPNGGWTRFSSLQTDQNIFGICITGCRPRGDWLIRVTYDPVNCPPPEGACCFGTQGCFLAPQAACQGAGGSWKGPGSVCGTRDAQGNFPGCIAPPNQPPTAQAGSDQTVTDSDNSGAETLVVDGSASTDLDGFIANYRWTEGPTLLQDGPALLSRDFPVGVHTLTLTVTDNAGATATDTVVLTVNPGTPQCVADVDDGSGTGTPDGGVTIDDLLYYLAIFEAGTIDADVDDGSGTGTPDGGVTIDDLLYYLFRFEAGC
jgi:hypothetical protein